MRKLFLLGIFVSLVMLSGLAYSATTWYIPEGCTRGFDLWILVANTNSTAANITYTFYTANNGTLTHTETVNANSRLSIYANAKINAAAGTTIEDDVSTKVECTNGLNIYAERAMYWPSVGAAGGVSGAWTGGHSARAISGTEGCYNEIGQPSSFPITISTAGSYKLIGNLSCSTQDVNAIEITASNVTLDLNGFTITGPGYDQGTTGNGINIDGSTTPIKNITIINGTIKDFRKIGINAVGKGTFTNSNQNFSLSNLKFDTNGQWGAYLYYTSGTKTENCSFYACGTGETTGITGGLFTSAVNTVKNNNFFCNKGYGIYNNGECCIIDGNNTEYTSNNTDVGTGVGIYSSNYSNSITSNTCIYNKYCGIYMAGNNGSVRNNNCSYNYTLASASGSGIYVTGSNNLLEHNNSSSNPEYGMYINGPYNSVENNICSGNTNRGIFADTNGDYNRIINNHCTNSNSGGNNDIRVSGDHNVVGGNIVQTGVLVVGANNTIGDDSVAGIAAGSIDINPSME